MMSFGRVGSVTGLLGPVLTAEEKRSVKVHNLTFSGQFFY